MFHGAREADAILCRAARVRRPAPGIRRRRAAAARAAALVAQCGRPAVHVQGVREMRGAGPGGPDRDLPLSRRGRLGPRPRPRQQSPGQAGFAGARRGAAADARGGAGPFSARRAARGQSSALRVPGCSPALAHSFRADPSRGPGHATVRGRVVVSVGGCFWHSHQPVHTGAHGRHRRAVPGGGARAAATLGLHRSYQRRWRRLRLLHPPFAPPLPRPGLSDRVLWCCAG
mmetsp:Transcript_6999/g.22962  ORF Transcript_6999/g.22962 Transcript_6999/m.22962 type:complete len:230 (+) Transcript_6999:1251-1940(+)